jgi:peptide/nickel transport system ATP-binding protein
MLIGALPKVGVKYEEQKLVGIPGYPPLLLNPPEGCRFSDRCPLAFEKCLQVPRFVEIEPNHFTACWKEVPPNAQA